MELDGFLLESMSITVELKMASFRTNNAATWTTTIESWIKKIVQTSMSCLMCEKKKHQPEELNGSHA